ncbi:MAG: FAD-dependent oxidoreductase, partial [Clostridia bacterium]|nr:FAD-dependent oxidoreductase [Clostridia bacterium]
LTVEDLTAGRRFADVVATSAFNIDIHHADDNAQHTVRVPCYHIPYRALVPKGLEGLLVAGRCISGTHEAQASYRVTGDCSEMGEAAGLAAAEAALRDCGLREVDVKRIRAIVAKGGAIG